MSECKIAGRIKEGIEGEKLIGTLPLFGLKKVGKRTMTGTAVTGLGGRMGRLWDGGGGPSSKERLWLGILGETAAFLKVSEASI